MTGDPKIGVNRRIVVVEGSPALNYPRFQG